MPAGHFTFVGCDKSKQKHALLCQRSAGTQFSAVTLLQLIIFHIGQVVHFGKNFFTEN